MKDCRFISNSPVTPTCLRDGLYGVPARLVSGEGPVGDKAVIDGPRQEEEVQAKFESATQYSTIEVDISQIKEVKMGEHMIPDGNLKSKKAKLPNSQALRPMQQARRNP